MMISVDHETIYRYDCPVILEPHTFRLRPRMTTTQRLLEYDLQILPTPAGSAESIDQDGNLALLAWFNAPASELIVRSRFRVELLRHNPFDFHLSDDAQRLALWYSSPLSESLVSYRDDSSVDDEVRQFATEVGQEANWNLIAFLTLLNRRIFERSSHISRLEGAAWSSAQTFGGGAGSCRDLAVLFCDACRVMGIAARFVSGYECASAGVPDATMHAWAEVFVPAAGWRGYDPSRGLAVADGHVAVAAAFDAALAAPISGLYSGACTSRMETRLEMRRE